MSDDAARFRHHWPEASRLVGLPDSPVVHLAVRTIADRLLHEYGSRCPDQKHAPIAAMRCASRACLENESFDLTAMRFLVTMGMEVDAELEARAWEPCRTPWLKQAADTIAADGGEHVLDTSIKASAYGWRST